MSSIIVLESESEKRGQWTSDARVALFGERMRDEDDRGEAHYIVPQHYVTLALSAYVAGIDNCA